jgi:hypothetical protein
MPGRKGSSELFARFVQAHGGATHARRELLEWLLGEGAPELVPSLRAGLADPLGRAAALDAIRYLPLGKQLLFLPEIVAHAGAAHGLSGAFLELLLTLPRVAAIEATWAYAENAIATEGDEEAYRAPLRLFVRLEALEDARRIAERALASSDPEIRQAGSDYLDDRG